jgi:rhamnosyltransferase
MLASIIIRTLNEARYLDDLLQAVEQQDTDGFAWEVVLVDSGSTDGTLEIAQKRGCRIYHIMREEFSFGRSLNIGCEAARGDILVFISGHCVPTGPDWLQSLCQPIIDEKVAYSYGRQVGDDDSYYSERRIFAKYFPAESALPQPGFYCNNANSALARAAWKRFPFNEELTGLEDMEVAKRLAQAGEKIGYAAEACVFHHHQESWRSVRRRFEREAIALQKIMPEVHLSKRDVVRYIANSILMDWRSALRTGQFARSWLNIAQYRFMQYWGAYRGNHEHRKLSHQQKEIYFYPSTPGQDNPNDWLLSHRRAAPNEGK